MSDNHTNDSSAAPQQKRKAVPLPKKPRRANPLLAFINFLFTMAVIAVLALGGLVYWGKQEFDAASVKSGETVFEVKKGARLRDIARKLEDDGLISNAWVFELGARAYKKHNRIRAGEFELAANASMRQILDTFVSGKAVHYMVTLPEGWTSEQIVARLNANKVLTGELDAVPAEGTLLPETYSFSRGQSRADIIGKMEQGMQTALAEAWAARQPDLPLKSPLEMLILASVVEKETAKADERPQVAAVFVNRLRKGMKLQSDPTILYGLYGGKAWTTDRSGIKRSELKKKNPYNTYQIAALPPGPIGNPGRAALMAVANPADTDDLFFVADGTGGHIFAKTYKQHQKNVAEWRKVEKARRKRQAEAKRAAEAEKDNKQ
ncbi:endolytic transglycosylase MltG [Polycladidibacter hongkongensis]|uniref:endolytic transglycosylase MltG n=1 Tax=Polycladidibacter hongkongensis TaxID=1647556 RepID=UPI00082DA1CA|nr:endolytic transglycosylase MltG [Pseudovibrio hongkongensis]